MKTLHLPIPRRLILLSLASFAFPALAQESQSLSAKELAARLGAAVQDGNSAARLRLKVEPASGGEKTVLQVQIKARRSKGKSEVLYQVLWPNERKGESFMLRQQDGKSPEGHSFQPPQTLSRLDRSKMTDSVFGGDLAYQDVIENFFLWSNQSLKGSEKVERVECVILESKPGGGDSTPYSKVVSWIDPKKLVAMRVEKYDASGKVARRIETTQVIKDDSGRHIPAGLVVKRPSGGTSTEIDGSNIRHDVDYTDADFTTQSMTKLSVPR